MPVAERLSKTVMEAPRTKIQAPEKFQIPRSNQIESLGDRRRRGEDTAPYQVSEIEFIPHGCAGRFVNWLRARQVREHDEVIRRDGLGKCR